MCARQVEEATLLQNKLIIKDLKKETPLKSLLFKILLEASISIEIITPCKVIQMNEAALL